MTTWMLGATFALVFACWVLASRARDRCERALLLLYLGQREDWGYALRKRVEAETGVVIPTHRVYPHLRELERVGLLESWEEEPARSRLHGDQDVPRIYYRLRRTAPSGTA